MAGRPTRTSASLRLDVVPRYRRAMTALSAEATPGPAVAVAHTAGPGTDERHETRSEHTGLHPLWHSAELALG
jgi:hypothetical protein